MSRRVDPAGFMVGQWCKPEIFRILGKIFSCHPLFSICFLLCKRKFMIWEIHILSLGDLDGRVSLLLNAIESMRLSHSFRVISFD